MFLYISSFLSHLSFDRVFNISPQVRSICEFVLAFCDYEPQSKVFMSSWFFLWDWFIFYVGLSYFTDWFIWDWLFEYEIRINFTNKAVWDFFISHQTYQSSEICVCVSLVRVFNKSSLLHCANYSFVQVHHFDFVCWTWTI